MKINRNTSSFGGPSRRRTRLPIVPIVVALLVIGFLWLIWTRGGEQPQQRVEKAIPAEQLGK